MKTCAGWLALMTVLASSHWPANAEEVTAPDGGTIVMTDPVHQGREMIEDVEVLRAILAREIRALYAADGTSESGGAAAGTAFHSVGDLYVAGGPPGAMASMDGIAGMMNMGYGGYGSGAMGPMSPMGGTGMAGAPLPPPTTASNPLGAYVEGLGIVYQLELPAFAEPPVADEHTDESQCTWLSQTDWQRTRAVMRGELKIADCQKCHDMGSASGGEGTLHDFIAKFKTGKRRAARTATGQPTREELTDALVELLARYGHHVRHLAADERIAVAVTVRFESRRTGSGTGMPGESYGPGGYSGSGGDYDGGEYGTGSAGGGGDSGAVAGSGEAGGYGSGASGYDDSTGGYGPGAASGAIDAPGGSPFSRSPGYQPQQGRRGISGLSGRAAAGGPMPAMGAGPSADGSSGLTGDAGSDELSGDLYLRQGRAADAAAAYERALLNVYGLAETGPNPAVPPHAVLSDLFGQGWRPPDRGLVQKLLQAYAAAGNLDKARAVLEKWTEKSAGEQPRRSASADEARAVPLPARLVISATKEQLDAVASGKLSAEDFRQQAHVAWFDPQASGERRSAKSAHENVSGVVITAASDNLVEISLGADDGLQPGRRLRLWRGATEIAHAEVTRVEADRSTARLTSRAPVDNIAEILPGDRVTPAELTGKEQADAPPDDGLKAVD